MSSKLTERQKQVYLFIRETIDHTGHSPTIREIGERFAIRNPNGVVAHLHALIKKGVIDVKPRISRGITLLREPDRCSLLKLAEDVADGVITSEELRERARRLLDSSPITKEKRSHDTEHNHD